MEVWLSHGQQLHHEPGHPELMRPAGVFVTLHVRRPGHPLELRGCIGTFEASAPLVNNVSQMAIAAATRDPRFPPVSVAELDQIVIEISVLSPRRRVRPEQIEVGRHGIYITRGAQRGVLLPQVAVEHGWDAATFLDHTCLKAGLPPGSWREDPSVEIEVFSAEILSEDPDAVDRGG